MAKSMRLEREVIDHKEVRSFLDDEMKLD